MDRIHSPKINPHLYSQLIFDRGRKHIQWATNSLFNKLCWENWTVTCRKMKLGHFLTSHTRINSKQIKDFNVRPQTIKILEENIVTSMFNLKHCSQHIFSDISPQARKTKEKINKWDYIKLKSFGTAKETINKTKKTTQCT